MTLEDFMNSGWNPIRKYNDYKQEATENHQFIMPFWERMWGIFFLFSGYLQDPDRDWDKHHGSNQWGIYDYLTLRIPRTIEDICLGNWCASIPALKIFCMVLTFPVWISLGIVRYGFGTLCSPLAFPFVLYVYLADEKKAKDEPEVQKIHQPEPEPSDNNGPSRKLINNTLILKKTDMFPRFEELPVEVKTMVVSHLDKSADQARFLTTSKYYYDTFFEEHFRIMLKPLHRHGGRCEWDVARKIWSRNPALLTLKLKGSTDYPGPYHYKDRSLYQIACMNQENGIDFGDDNEIGIVEEMEMILASDKQQRQIAEEQLAEIFPNGEVIEYDYDMGVAMELLLNVYVAVSQDDVINEKDLFLMNDDTRAARDVLLNYLNPEKFNRVQKGLVFDAWIYRAALQYFDETFINGFQNLCQRDFFRIRVCEKIATLLPTGYLRLHVQGINNIVYKGDKLKDGGAKLHDGTPYFPGSRPSNSIPGEHFYIGICGQRNLTTYWIEGQVTFSSAGVEPDHIGKIIWSKERRRAGLMLKCASRNIGNRNLMK